MVKLIGMFAGFMISVFLARTLGAEGLGIINLSNTVGSLILIFVLFGFTNVLIKKIAISHSNNNWPSINNSIFTSLVFNGVLAVSVVLVFLKYSNEISIYIFKNEVLKIPLMLIVISVIPLTITRILSSSNDVRNLSQIAFSSSNAFFRLDMSTL